MSGRGVPAPYAGASRLGVDGNAMLALARAIWHTLTLTQRRALVEAEHHLGRVWLRASTGMPTRRVLVERGLADAATAYPEHGRAALTGLGLMVREAGVYTLETPS